MGDGGAVEPDGVGGFYGDLEDVGLWGGGRGVSLLVLGGERGGGGGMMGDGGVEA